MWKWYSALCRSIRRSHHSHGEALITLAEWRFQSQSGPKCLSCLTRVLCRPFCVVTAAKIASRIASCTPPNNTGCACVDFGTTPVRKSPIKCTVSRVCETHRIEFSDGFADTLDDSRMLLLLGFANKFVAWEATCNLFQLNVRRALNVRIRNHLRRRFGNARASSCKV